MSGLAHVLLELGHEVSGSDREPSNFLERLGGQGARVCYGHNRANVKGAAVVVVSSAVPQDNPELEEARNSGIPIVHRGDVLADLMASRFGIAVAGCHGKTTTTCMVAMILERGGMDPTVIVGGELDEIGGNAKLGKGCYFVAEADESDGSFLKLRPHVAVITNVEDDHLDHYRRIEGVIEAFREFSTRVPPDGRVVLSGDEANLEAIALSLGGRALTFGMSPEADFSARHVRLEGMGSRFVVAERGREYGEVCLGVPGLHNVSNALASLAVGRFLGLEFETVSAALQAYRGVHRRFETIGLVGGVRVIDDYAHHPTEIKATLSAARGATQGRVICVFQPHRYSRTGLLAAVFGLAFRDADEVIITPLYAAGEQAVPGVDSGLIVASIERSQGTRPRLVEMEDIPGVIAEMARPGDTVLLMGAGDIWKCGQATVKALEERHKGGS